MEIDKEATSDDKGLITKDHEAAEADSEKKELPYVANEVQRNTQVPKSSMGG